MPRVCYGGTFDPVHLGQVAIATGVADALSAPVFLLPAADPPHRPPPGASAEPRALMLDLAVGCDASLRVDRRELRRRGPSYTVDTLRELRAECGPDLPLVWVLGIDSLRQLDSWHHWRELFDHAHLLGVERPGAPVGADWLQAQAPAVAVELERRRGLPGELVASPAGRFAELPIRPLRPESATEVRSRITAGRDWEALVPPAVARFIHQQGLYGTAGAGAGV